MSDSPADQASERGTREWAQHTANRYAVIHKNDHKCLQAHEPLIAHEWVVDAVQAAYAQGKLDAEAVAALEQQALADNNDSNQREMTLVSFTAALEAMLKGRGGIVKGPHPDYAYAEVNLNAMDTLYDRVMFVCRRLDDGIVRIEVKPV